MEYIIKEAIRVYNNPPTGPKRMMEPIGKGQNETKLLEKDTFEYLLIDEDCCINLPTHTNIKGNVYNISKDKHNTEYYWCRVEKRQDSFYWFWLLIAFLFLCFLGLTYTV